MFEYDKRRAGPTGTVMARDGPVSMRYCLRRGARTRMALLAAAFIWGAGPPAIVLGQSSVSALKKQVADLQAELSAARLENAKLKTELDRANQRIRELEERLRRLGGDRPPDSAASGEGLSWPTLMDYPERKLGRFGMVEESETKLAGPFPGATEVRLASYLEPKDELSGISMHPEGETRKLSFTCKFPSGERVEIAILALRDDDLFWTWNRFSPADITDKLEQLDRFLVTCVIEVSGSGRIITRLQFFPSSGNRMVTIRRAGAARRSDRLPEAYEDMRLEGGPAADGWSIDEEGVNGLRYEKDGQAFVVKLDPKVKRIIRARWELDYDLATQMRSTERRIAELATEIRSTEMRIARLKASLKGAKPSEEAKVKQDIKEAEKRRSELKRRHKKLESELDVLHKKQKTLRRRVDVSVCKARIVLPNGAALYQLSFKD